MADAQYDVVFSGDLTGDYEEEAVRRNLAALFKIPSEQIGTLFTGKPVTVKSGVDETTARKLEAAFRKAGAICELRPAAGGGDTGGRESSAESERGEAAEASASGGASAASAGEPVPSEQRSSIEVAGDPNETIVHRPVPQDLGDLGFDDSEAPLESPRVEGTPEIDTSELSLDEPDTRLNQQGRPAEPDIDISGISMEPPPSDSGSS